MYFLMLMLCLGFCLWWLFLLLGYHDKFTLNNSKCYSERGASSNYTGSVTVRKETRLLSCGAYSTIFPWSYQRWYVRQDLSHVLWVTHIRCAWETYSLEQTVCVCNAFAKYASWERCRLKLKKKVVNSAIHKNNLQNSWIISNYRFIAGKKRKYENVIF
jgi:hypothetical protein